jgi:hypothetical protein
MDRQSTGLAAASAAFVLAAGLCACSAASGPYAPQTVLQPSSRARGTTIVLKPATLSFTSAGQKLKFTASEKGYKGTFSAKIGSVKIAKMTPAKGRTFTVTAVKAGKTVIEVTDTQKNKGSVTVSVTTTGGVIQ